MLAPLDALSVAAAVVQFVDFGSHLFSDAREIHKSSSGRTLKTTDLKDVTKQLIELTNDIETKLNTAKTQQQNTDVAANSQDPSERIFISLCGSCKEICAQLEVALSTLEAHNRDNHKWFRKAAESFLVAWRGVLSAEKIKELKERLNQTKQGIMTSLLV